MDQWQWLQQCIFHLCHQGLISLTYMSAGDISKAHPV